MQLAFIVPKQKLISSSTLLWTVARDPHPLFGVIEGYEFVDSSISKYKNLLLFSTMALETIVERGAQSMGGYSENRKDLPSEMDIDIGRQTNAADDVQSHLQAFLDAEKAVVRRLDWRIVPILSVLCRFISFHFQV